ncbi:formyltransferase family protein [Desulfotignum phosphitoxidans]|uniref:Hexapeptide repeat-containing transferase n=1 Tax=Desulfotignum phosphitoxidans DSM 13687 TaxID=1286635 RepID=S0FWY6_9BACT|nr:formyltransferase family protein [Desulfotignum phosphitoxidans]EMS77654.1 hexapeptide repeat-containing transferase [Desulfotignum phosphitoxidans DSM 13687]
MNYLLFANPYSGGPILKELFRSRTSPKIVVTFFNNVDTWKRILLRFLKKGLTVEDRCRFLYKIKFYDYYSLHEERLKKIIEKEQIDIAFITTFSRIIPASLIDLFPKGVYNLHPSLLPKHGGANPIFWVIYDNDEFTGTTCHKAIDQIDAGEIIYQNKYKVQNMTGKQLFYEYTKDCSQIIRKVLNEYEDMITDCRVQNNIEYDPQNIPALDELKILATDKESKRRVNKALSLFNKSI